MAQFLIDLGFSIGEGIVMKVRFSATAKSLMAVALAIAAGSGATKAAEAPVEVMIVGTFHMANPGQDLYNAKVDDMRVPARQAEIAKAVQEIARFRPTIVAAERSAAAAEDGFGKYLAQGDGGDNNEVAQLAYRLGREAGLHHVYGIDSDGDFPFEAVAEFAVSHGRQDVLDAAGAIGQSMVKGVEDHLREGSVGSTLRWLNRPDLIAEGNGFYRRIMQVGAGDEQPGAALLTAWYGRNARICAKMEQLAHPGDRIVVFFGAGHAHMLRQCVSETPGYRLVEANDYLRE